jgi:hypothetical protein
VSIADEISMEHRLRFYGVVFAESKISPVVSAIMQGVKQVAK